MNFVEKQFENCTKMDKKLAKKLFEKKLCTYSLKQACTVIKNLRVI